MARKIRFPLKMKNGAEVRTLDQLKENFDLESVLGYFVDGKLSTWLADRYYDEKAEAVSALSADMPELNTKLCEILEVEYQADEDDTDLELIHRRKEKYRILSTFTTDKELLDNIDNVAMSQKDLFSILENSSAKKIYLYGNVFSIPFKAKENLIKLTYIGLNSPLIVLENDKQIYEYEELGIIFKDVLFEEIINPYLTKGEALYLENKYEEAFPLVKEAAENGNPRAMYIMILYYSYGYEVVSIDEGDCFDWGEKSFAYKEPLSRYGYACWCLEESSNEQKNIYTQIFNEIESLAEREDIIAQVVLGDMYRLGHGVGQDYSKAVEWYKKAAEQGYANAQFNLGNMYRLGNGVRQDYSKAAEWYRKAAEHGVAQAQNNLGSMYYNGNGVEQDYSKAVEWYKKAAEQEYAWAQCNLGSMYYNGNGVRQDYSKAFNWFRIASGHEFAPAQFNLGYMYENGYGVERDYSKAIELYRKAAEQGDAKAKNRLDHFGIYGSIDF